MWKDEWLIGVLKFGSMLVVFVGCFLVEYTFGYCAPEFDYFQKGKNNIGLLFVLLD